MAKPIILLADGSMMIRQVVGLVLDEAGYEVQSVSDGEAAIAAVRAQRPALVIAAVDLEKKDGYEVCTLIKREEELAKIPVLLTSHSFEKFNEARATMARCDGRLAKPFEPAALKAKVKELVGEGSR